MEKETIGVSACLIGINCKYNGKNNLNQRVLDFIKGKAVVFFCPEELGGLTTPRVPAEINHLGKVINEEGLDVSLNYHQGAKKTLEIIKTEGARAVILKDGSPSCGYKWIYDGNFSKTKIKGEGILFKYLAAEGITIIDLET